MIKGIGVDIVDLDRINPDSEKFVKKILSDKEICIFQTLTSTKRKKEFLGGRFAGKEAYLKACGKGLGDISFKEIEILNASSGAPYMMDPEALISISHEKKYAVAYVIIEERRKI